MAASGPRDRTGGSRYRNGNGNGNYRNGNGNGNGNDNGRGYGTYELRRATAKEQLQEILHVVFKRKQMIATLFLLIAIPAALATWGKPKKYIAIAKVNIATDRADMTIQPTDANSLSMVKLNQSIVNSEVHLIRSRDMLEHVARRLEVARAKGGVVGLANAEDGDSVKIGQAALSLSRSLRVNPVRGSNIIEISYVSDDQKRAAEIVQRVLEEYLKYNAEVHGQPGLTDFYEEQSRLLEQTLRRAEEGLRDYSYREGLVAPVREIEAQVVSLARLEETARELDSSVAGVEEKIRVIREQLVEQPPLVKRAQYLDVNPVVNQLRSHLLDRKMDRVALLRKYTEKERLVRDNNDEISELQRQLDDVVRDQPTVVSQQVFRPNPIYEGRLARLLDLEANLKAFRAQKLVDEEAVAKIRHRLVLLKRKGLEFSRREQDVARRRAMLELYEKRGQEARISQAMDKKQLVNVEVVQRPALPLPRTDKRGTPLILALISGLAVALGGAFGWEYLTRTLRFERDVEQLLGLPVLGTVRDTTQA